MTQLKTLTNIVKCSVKSIPLNLGFFVKPKYVWLETTDRCNSRCQTCNIWNKVSTSQNELLSLDDLKRCLQDPLMSNVKYVLNSGGEPTLVDLKKVLAMEHSALPKAALQISSNGLLPHKLVEDIRFAIDIGVEHIDVGLSIDGVGEAHDRVRGVKGNFVSLEVILNYIKFMQYVFPNRVFVTLGSTLTDTTAQEAQSLYDYCRSRDVPFMWHWFNTSSFYENESSKLADNIQKVIEEFPAQSLYLDMWRESLVTGKIPKFRCHSLNTFLAIRCNGDVVPCLSRWSQPIGNIKEQSISDIWKSVPANIERMKIKECTGCLNSWGYGWSVPESYYLILIDVIKKKMRKIKT